MTGLCDINLKFRLNLVISVFMSSFNFMLNSAGPGRVVFAQAGGPSYKSRKNHKYDV